MGHRGPDVAEPSRIIFGRYRAEIVELAGPLSSLGRAGLPIRFFRFPGIYL
jgi:hypothetical protein